MRITMTLTAAALLGLGLVAAHAADKTVPGGTGIEQSTEGQGATNKQTSPNPPMGSMKGANTGTEPGTGIEDSVQGEGATNKAGKDDRKEGKTGMATGASSGNAPGGTGIEESAEGDSATQKN